MPTIRAGHLTGSQSQMSKGQRMRRTVTSVVLLTLVLFGSIGSGPVAGQESTPGTPTTTPLPTGVAAMMLATQEMGPLPPVPAWVGLARFTFAAAAQTPEQVVPGPTLFIVETGTITFELGSDLEGESATPASEGSAMGPGEQFFVPANSSYSSRNDSGAPATALRVVIYPSAPVISPATGVTYQLLTGGIAQSLPSAPAWVTVSRVSLATGADVSSRTRIEDGPDLIFIESGLVSLALPGAEVVLAPGGTAVIQANNATTIRNADARPSNLLVLTLSGVPSEDGLSTPVV